MHGATALHATACVRKFDLIKISNAPSDDFLHAHMQIMRSSNHSHPAGERQDGKAKDPSSREVKRGALQRERSSSVQTDLTGQTMRDQSSTRGRSRWTGRSRDGMADAKKFLSKKWRKWGGLRSSVEACGRTAKVIFLCAACTTSTISEYRMYIYDLVHVL